MRVVISGYYGYGNGGDEALLVTLLQMLPPQVQPVVLSAQPQVTQALYGVAACDRWRLGELLTELRRSQGFIWGGGSLIQDSTSIASPLYYLGLMSLAQGMGRETLAWAQGVGPLQRRWVRWLAGQVFRRCTQVTVRDAPAAHQLYAWGRSVLLAPDPVWALADQPYRPLADLPAPRMAVALRPHRYLTPAWLDTITKALQQFQQATGVWVVLLPFQPATDLDIARHLHQALGERASILQPAHPAQLKGVFRGIELVVTMRYHGLVMGAAAGCRCFSLSYDPKVRQLQQELAMPGLDLQQIPPPASELSRQWLDLYANGEGLSSEQVQSWVDRALLHREVLHQMWG
ncbi:polysaccharide pyruvyl transferase CsaB [Gloeomargarita lithophora Alchichica-D10]|uniref:Polysaccharide pyruvyl transferase CsaB n=1 Tax=Gloeomargarita lithophora Alchichica-D10 TaxID=1188229 RepID=A0A1J0AES5_9CYAN|nr:polysaccharide pyruvyl transferase CsaB [Gloeomargarita lithophora]APB34446.1 polysaccharide pyruvyl transferase CsaB [Gloeomargarita lithophora Alchichica-D10]